MWPNGQQKHKQYCCRFKFWHLYSVHFHRHRSWEAFSVIFYTQFTWKNLAYTNIKYQHFFGRSGLRMRLLVWSSCTNHTWLTDHPCIFCVTTVMDTNTIVRAIIEFCLIPCTVHIIQKDWSNSTVKNVAGNSNRYCICNQNETLSQN